MDIETELSAPIAHVSRLRDNQCMQFLDATAVMTGKSLRIEESNLRRRAWIISGALHLLFFGLVAIEVSLKASTVLDLIFYSFRAPGILIGFPVAMLFGIGGTHGEGVFFGILLGLPFNVIAYYWAATLVMKVINKDLR